MFFVKHLFIFLLLPSCALSQQQYIFQHLTVEDGLLSNPRMNVFQDAEGYYWFSSVNGLQRFDGKDFVTYKFPYRGTRGLEEDWIGSPIEDSQKNIWVRTGEGIFIYDRRQRVLSRLYMSDAPDSNVSNICNVVKDRGGQMWVITNRNIFRYDYSSHQPLIQETSGEDYRHVIYDKNKNGFWIILEKFPHEIIYFDCSARLFSPPLKYNVVLLFGHDNPISIFKMDTNNNIWISDYLGDLCKYNPVSEEVIHYSILHDRKIGKVNLPNAAFRDCFDDGDAIWFIADNFEGLVRYDKKSASFSIIQNENGNEYGLHYQSEGYSLFRDGEGNIWVNTDMGMNIFNPNLQQFKYLKTKVDPSIAQFSTAVTSFFESSRNEIWVSTWGAGIFRYDSNLNLLRNYIHIKNDPFSLGEPLSRTWTFGEDSSGRIWVGCQYGMLSVLDLATGKFVNRNIPEFEKRTIVHIVKDRENNFWFALHSGLLGKWDAASGKIFVYKNLYTGNEKNIHAIDGLCADKNNNIWVAAGNDVLDCFGQNGNALFETVLTQNHVRQLTMLNDSVVIGGSLGKGLFFYNVYTKSTRFFNIGNGLSSNNVFGALVHNPNDIWILTNNAIERLNPANGKVSKYGVDDGVTDHVFESAMYELKNGTIMVAANSGIIYFNPDSIKTIPPPPDVVITAMRIEQKDVSVDSLLQYNTIHLEHNQNLINIEFASLSFAGRKSNEYYYELEGADHNWISAGKQRSVTYANLASGHYTFKVKSKNRDGVESDHITSLNIVISPPWWKTWWAYTLWIIIAAGLVFAVYDYRKRNRRELAKVRQKIAGDLHDDIGSTLNSISVYSEIAGRQLQSNTENAKDILNKMGVASRNMIDNMNDIVWAINPKNDQFENILHRMQYFAGELLSGKNILLHFSADEKVRNIKLSMARRKNFYLIFKEAINNAFKYSNAKTVAVRISSNANRMTMVIADDGSGFDTRIQSDGNGLNNMKVRANEIGAHITVSSSLNKGTEVNLQMPV